MTEQKDENPQATRLTRAQSFLGIHFDLHAREDCTEMGRDLTHEMIEAVIDQVQPDYVQCDCKGHPGYASYPTEVGTPASDFVKDPLRIWRDVTAERGVALYVHYSGVIDEQAVTQHPEWARIDENGEPDDRTTSTFGPYVDELLIPQIKELIDKYDVDGAWIDGDCWGTKRDYGAQVTRAFREETGIELLPRDPDDPHYFEFSEFCREQFRRYLDHYVTEIHAYAPGFQIASNWAYTDHMPEPPTIDVDYISGDYSLQNSVNAARYQARCIRGQGKPWDLMAWSFARRRPEPCNATKSPAQLKQEAAIVLSQGGGFQAYFKQKRDASIYPWQMALMGEVAQFCRARQTFCHRAEAVPQVALLYAGRAFYRKAERLFAPGDDLTPLKGVLNALLESQYSVEIVMEHQLEGRMDAYPLIVVPEWAYLDAAFKDELLAYVEQGGNLLLIGPESAALFEDALPIEWTGEIEDPVRQWLGHGNWLTAMYTASRRVALEAGARAVGRLYQQNDPTAPSQPAAIIADYGEGRIAATTFNFGERYIRARSSVARDFLAALVRTLFPEPLVEVAGSHNVDVSVNRIAGHLAVNLVNTAGPHADPSVYVFDEVPPVGPLDITMRIPRPTSLRLEPAGEPLDYTYGSGRVRLTLPRLDIHQVIVVER
ncbi:MAG: hypothetical protein ACP5JG_17440 [Anaerolineae bacterium]